MVGQTNESFQMDEGSLRNGNLVEIKMTTTEDAEPADFETAISAAKWGKFNLIIYFVAFIIGWTSIFETTTMSYVFPAAECDLELELYHKGLLNAVTYAGMISSAFIWGFLCDTLGRKKLLAIGALLDGVFVLMSSMSQNLALLMTAKFFGGVIINGPFAALTSYLSEFHNSSHRARVQMVLGTSMSCGTLLLPILAMGILPLDLKWWISEHFVIHSWNIYLLICSIPSLTSGICMIFLPESPKFLMTTGRNEKALKVFKMVYRINTGKSEDTYPIKKLVDETAKHASEPGKHGGGVTANRTKKMALLEGWQQIKPLFFPPHLCKIILVCSLQFLVMMSLNTLRLWLPQVFQAINDYKADHAESADLCTMISVFQTKQNFTNVTIDKVEEVCTVNHNNIEVYTNSMIVSAITIMGYVVAGSLINIVGKKRLLCILGTASGTMAISMYFARNAAATIALSSLFVGSGSISINVVLAIVVDLFPTTLRTMTVSLTMMIGRSGPLIGNMIFPLLLAHGCLPPFLFVGCAILACSLLACILPNTDQKALE